MHESERIYKQIVASGREWKACEQCGGRFEPGEIITAVQIYSGRVIGWICCNCTEEWLGPCDDELKLKPPAECNLIVVNAKAEHIGNPCNL